MPKYKADFSLKDSDIERITEAIKRVGAGSEEVINNYLHNIAGKKFIDKMTKYIPVSDRPNVIHAKTGNWSEQENFNLAVTMGNSVKGKRGTSFYYLYYVIKGESTSKKKGARDFLNKGLDEEYNNVVDGLIDEMSKKINKEL